MTHNPDGVDTHQPDAFDDAMVDGPSYFGGQVAVDAYTCVLVKGVGKVPYDSTAHQGERTSTAIIFDIAPLDPTRKMIKREMLNWVSEFRGVVRPSIEELVDDIAAIKGLTIGQFNTLREFNGMYCTGEFVPRPDNKPGQMWTTIAFRGVFATEEECAAAYAELIGEEPEAVLSEDEQAERTSLAAFLSGLWTQANHKTAAMKELLESNEMLSKYFNMDSPEVKELVDADPSADVPF